jgi:4-hydroxybenzoate polyprenyltransferase
LGYDTIYGIQDISDDEIIGLKSTSIKFKKNIKKFVSISYLITSLIAIYLFKDIVGLNIFTLLLSLFFTSLFYQIIKFKTNNSKTCLDAFKFNNISGLLLFIAILSLNLQI